MEDPRIGRVLDDRYRLDERLAAGGMGVVYRAERLGLAKPVAVKFLHKSSAVVPGHRQRFEREAAAMSRLTHPNLVSIIDFGSSEGLPYLVMEYHDGVTLRRLLKEGALPLARGVFIARQMLAGLASAHGSGVVHRDLKPANVLLVGRPGEDLVKILDFGVAKLLDSGGPTELSVVAGTVLGTPEYMSPEQARSLGVDPRSDVYAVGILLYEMVTGRRPFEGEEDLAILRMQVEELPRPPSELESALSVELEAAIVRALEKQPDRRWQSASEFGAALAEVPEVRASAAGGAARRAGGSKPLTRVKSAGGNPRVVPHQSPLDRRGTRGVPGDPPTLAATPQALARRRRRRRRGKRRSNTLGVAVLVVLFAIGAAAGATWVAVDRGLIEWPSWLPWHP